MLDYDKMEAGPKIDAMVAEKAMGWTLHSTPRSVFYTGNHAQEFPNFSPSRTGGDALRVLERMEKRGWFSELNYWPKAQSAHKYGCQLWLFGSMGVCAAAPTRALAICRAALMAVALQTSNETKQEALAG